MDLSIIFVNWNAVAYLRECIRSIHDHTSGITFELIVVDNASPERDVMSLKEEFPAVELILSKENLGFARANNVGFRRSSGDHVLLLNPDTKLVNPAINLMLDRLRVLPDAGIVGCRHTNPDLSVQTTTIQRFPTVLNQLLNIEHLRLRWPSCRLWSIAPLFAESREPLPVEVIPGACMLLPRHVYESVGMLSEQYFMYGEDIDLNRKVALAGLRRYYVPDAVIIHYGGRSSGQQRQSQWATTMKYRAMSQYYVTHHGRAYAALYRTAMGLSAAGRLVALGAAYPLGVYLHRTQSLRAAASKWGAVLKWACGFASRPVTAAGIR